MEGMNIAEAARWANQNKKPICRPNWIYTNRLSVNEGEFEWEDGGRGDIFLVEDFTATDWQPWEEPREYVGYWEAMTSIMTNGTEYKLDVPGHGLTYFRKANAVHVRLPSGPCLLHTDNLCSGLPKWYEVAPKAPDMEKYAPDSTDVFLEENIKGPVFDLTYEEAKYISGNDLLKVKCEVFVNGMRWKRSRGEWHDMHGNRIADVASWLKLKKWRIVTD